MIIRLRAFDRKPGTSGPFRLDFTLDGLWEQGGASRNDPFPLTLTFRKVPTGAFPYLKDAHKFNTILVTREGSGVDVKFEISYYSTLNERPCYLEVVGTGTLLTLAKGPIMNNSPIHVFAFADGTWIGASRTDQHHVSLEKAKRVRTVTATLEAEDGTTYQRRQVVVSAGLWFPSQLCFKPFLDAVKEASQQAAILEARGFDYVETAPWASREEADWLQRVLRVRNPLMLRALWLCAVKGYTKPSAIKVAGQDYPAGKNALRQLERIVRSAKAKLEERRTMNTHSGGMKPGDIVWSK